MPAKKGNKYAAGNKGGGRNPSYKKEYNDLAYKFCLLGATDKDLADFFEVSEQTINNWKKEHKEFYLSLKKGKIEADSVIAQKLFHRAKGYEHPDVHISNYQGEITTTAITKHYAPDTTAAIFWLKNRQPQYWRDKQEIDANVNSTTTIKVTKPENL
ncbi:MAG: terminase [Peptococcaceae bacterium BICA1-8]|nr:MAG: terminase [Peptococcaceae bacterium BICA1-8]